MRKAIYVFRVDGTLGPTGRYAMSDLTCRTQDGTTTLSGELDQAGVYGVIERLGALRLELIGVRRLEENADEHG